MRMVSASFTNTKLQAISGDLITGYHRLWNTKMDETFRTVRAMKHVQFLEPWYEGLPQLKSISSTHFFFRFVNRDAEGKRSVTLPVQL